MSDALTPDPPLSVAGLWRDTTGGLRANAALIFPVAAAFLFLPQLAGNELARALGIADDFGRQGPISIVVAFVGFIGQATITAIMLDGWARRARPLRDLLADAVRLIVPVFAVGLLTGLAIVAGLFVLVFPGLYLAGRLAPAIPVVVEERLGVGASLRRAWALTHDRGWPIALFVGLVGMLAVVGILMGALVATALESALSVAGVSQLGQLASTVAVAGLVAGASTILYAAAAAIYHHLVGPRDLARVFA